MRTLGILVLVCLALGACRYTEAELRDAAGEPTDVSDHDGAGPFDASLCFGAGLGRVCLTKAPTAPLMLTGTIDTGVIANCTEVVAAGGSTACVIAGTTVGVPTGTYRALGSRPLVIVASELMTIDGTVNVGSLRGGGTGAGASSAACNVPTAAESDGGGAGGGAGGTFAGPGGDGGTGDLNNNGAPAGTGAGGVHGALSTMTVLRGGCPGGNGGDGGGGATDIGTGSNGGGAVYLISAVAIHVTGRVLAFGAGGGGADEQSGGGGGGSGGMIGLDAPTVMVTGTVAANGGGGGEGGGLAGPRGVDGADGTADATPAIGGKAQTDGTTMDGGNGGAGSAGATLAGAGGGANNGGGGGGGGGAGFVYVKGTLAPSGTFSPSASVN